MRKAYRVIAELLVLTVFGSSVVVSCDEIVDMVKEPVFPTLVKEIDIEPGTELTLSFEPNMDWTVSVSEESFKWFKIKDGNFKVPSISGSASSGQTVTITIVTDSEESFSLRTCEVKLTMGGKTQTIAEYMLKAKAKVMETFAAVVEEDKFEITDGKYVYSEVALSESDVVRLVWDGEGRRFHFPLQVSANFEWTVEWPEWARADLDGNSRVGTVELDIYGIPSELPMNEAAAGVVVFKSGDNVMATYNIEIPAANAVFDWNLSYTSLTFDHLAYFHDSNGFTAEPLSGDFYGPEASRVLLMELTDNGYIVPDSPWLNIESTQWDQKEGSSVLQQRDLTISASRYSGEKDRHAVILFLPATAPEDYTKLLADGGMDVSEEYSQYAIPVVQRGRPSEFFTFEESESIRKDYKVEWKKSDEEMLPDAGLTFAPGCEEWKYELEYSMIYSSSRALAYITEPFDSYTVYDSLGVEVLSDDLADFWLSYNDMTPGYYGYAQMDQSKIKEKAPEYDEQGNPLLDSQGKPLMFPVTSTGYLVFKNKDGKALAVVKCVCVPEKEYTMDVLKDASQEMFASPQVAADEGASIYRIIAGPTYKKWVESTVNIYKLVYTVSDTSLDLLTSKSIFQYQCPGKFESGPEFVTVDDTDYLDENAEIGHYGYLLKYDESVGENGAYVGEYDGVTTIRMTLPEPDGEETEQTEDNGNLSEIIQFFDKDGSMILVLICELSVNTTI